MYTVQCTLIQSIVDQNPWDKICFFFLINTKSTLCIHRVAIVVDSRQMLFIFWHKSFPKYKLCFVAAGILKTTLAQLANEFMYVASRTTQKKSRREEKRKKKSISSINWKGRIRRCSENDRIEQNRWTKEETKNEEWRMKEKKTATQELLHRNTTTTKIQFRTEHLELCAETKENAQKQHTYTRQASTKRNK